MVIAIVVKTHDTRPMTTRRMEKAKRQKSVFKNQTLVFI
jgi:hypothetical protein